MADAPVRTRVPPPRGSRGAARLVGKPDSVFNQPRGAGSAIGPGSYPQATKGFDYISGRRTRGPTLPAQSTTIQSGTSTNRSVKAALKRAAERMAEEDGRLYAAERPGSPAAPPARRGNKPTVLAVLEGRAGWLGVNPRAAAEMPAPGDYGIPESNFGQPQTWTSTAALQRRAAARGSKPGADPKRFERTASALKHAAPHPKAYASYEDMKSAGRTPGPTTYMGSTMRDSIAGRVVGTHAALQALSSHMPGKSPASAPLARHGHSMQMPTYLASAVAGRAPGGVMPRAGMHTTRAEQWIGGGPRHAGSLRWLVDDDDSDAGAQQALMATTGPGAIGPGYYARAHHGALAIAPRGTNPGGRSDWSRASRFSNTWGQSSSSIQDDGSVSRAALRRLDNLRGVSEAASAAIDDGASTPPAQGDTARSAAVPVPPLNLRGPAGPRLGSASARGPRVQALQDSLTVAWAKGDRSALVEALATARREAPAAAARWEERHYIPAQQDSQQAGQPRAPTHASLSARARAASERRAAAEFVRESARAAAERAVEVEPILRQQRKWLTLLALHNRTAVLSACLRQYRSTKLGLDVRRAMGHYKRRMFLTWVQYYKQRKQIRAASVLQAQLGALIARYRVRKRRHAANVLVALLNGVHEVPTTKRTLWKYRFNVQRVQGWVRDMVSIIRAQQVVLHKQWDACLLGLRLQALKQKVLNARAPGRPGVEFAVLGSGARTVPAMALVQQAFEDEWQAATALYEAEAEQRGRAGSVPGHSRSRSASLAEELPTSPGFGDGGAAVQGAALWQHAVLLGQDSSEPITVGSLFDEVSEELAAQQGYVRQPRRAGMRGMRSEAGADVFGQVVPGGLSAEDWNHVVQQLVQAAESRAEKLQTAQRSTTCTDLQLEQLQEELDASIPALTLPNAPAHVAFPCAVSGGPAGALPTVRARVSRSRATGALMSFSRDPALAGMDLSALRPGAPPPRASARLPLETAATQLRVIADWPEVPAAQLEQLLQALLKRKRAVHSANLRAHAVLAEQWDVHTREGKELALARLALLKRGDVTLGERQALGALLATRRPRAPMFTPFIPYTVLLPIVRAAVMHARLHAVNVAPSKEQIINEAARHAQETIERARAQEQAAAAAAATTAGLPGSPISPAGSPSRHHRAASLSSIRSSSPPNKATALASLALSFGFAEPGQPSVRPDSSSPRIAFRGV